MYADKNAVFLHTLFLEYETQIGKKKMLDNVFQFLQFTCKNLDKSEQNRKLKIDKGRLCSQLEIWSNLTPLFPVLGSTNSGAQLWASDEVDFLNHPKKLNPGKNDGGLGFTPPTFSRPNLSHSIIWPHFLSLTKIKLAKKSKKYTQTLLIKKIKNKRL